MAFAKPVLLCAFLTLAVGNSVSITLAGDPPNTNATEQRAV